MHHRRFFAADPEMPVKKPEWAWITECQIISQTADEQLNPVVIISEKSLHHGNTLNGIEQYLLFRDPATTEYTYKYLLSDEILCTTMHRRIYESKR